MKNSSRFSDYPEQNKKLENLSDFIVNQDNEWLGSNWRKVRIGCRTMDNVVQKGRMSAFLEMIDSNFEFFPSL